MRTATPGDIALVICSWALLCPTQLLPEIASCSIPASRAVQDDAHLFEYFHTTPRAMLSSPHDKGLYYSGALVFTTPESILIYPQESYFVEYYEATYIISHQQLQQQCDARLPPKWSPEI